jgi:hypothetical protein
MTDDILQVSPQENAILTSPYTEDEIRKDVFQMEHNKALGPDGFLAEFYQSFWDIIKHDLLELFRELHVGQLDLFSINCRKIILLPKSSDAERIQQYRPICLLNICLKKIPKSLLLDSIHQWQIMWSARPKPRLCKEDTF